MPPQPRAGSSKAATTNARKIFQFNLTEWQYNLPYVVGNK